MSTVYPDRERERPPLGIGWILRETVSMITGNISQIVLLCLLPLIALNVLQFLSATGNYAPKSEDMSIPEFLAFIIEDSAYAVIFALLVKVFHDIKSNMPTSFGSRISSVFGVFVPLIICNLAATAATLIGLIAFIVPGLYLMALWSLLIPSIVIEEAGFQGFRRSANLTKHYRWLLVLLAAVFLVFDITIEFGGSSLFEHLLSTADPLDSATFILINAFKTFIPITFASALFTLIFIRLRDIKEDGLPEVFT